MSPDCCQETFDDENDPVAKDFVPPPSRKEQRAKERAKRKAERRKLFPRRTDSTPRKNRAPAPQTDRGEG